MRIVTVRNGAKNHWIQCLLSGGVGGGCRARKSIFARRIYTARTGGSWALRRAVIKRGKDRTAAAAAAAGSLRAHCGRLMRQTIRFGVYKYRRSVCTKSPALNVHARGVRRRRLYVICNI